MSIILIKSQEEFRKKLACCFDTVSVTEEEKKEEIKEKCINFISFLPIVFSDDLDRKSLWDRISNGIYSATTKCDNDFEKFINFILEFIKADAARVASNNIFTDFLCEVSKQTDEWKIAFINYCQTKYFILVTYARQRWESMKKKGNGNGNGK